MKSTPFRKAMVGVAGGTLVLLGLAGLLLPFLPGWLLILSGLAVLSSEYVWVRRLTDGAKRHAAVARRRDHRDDLAA